MGKDIILVVGFENICRLCLHATDAMSDIFPTSGKKSLQQQIYYIAGLSTKKGDGLPSKICYRCRYIVEQASELRDVVQKSQSILAKTVHNSSHSIDSVVKEADPEPFDNEIFLQTLTDTNDSTDSKVKLNNEQNSSDEQDDNEQDSSEEHFDTVFLPEDVDHTTEITADETIEEYKVIPSKKISNKPLTCQLCCTQLSSKEEVRQHVMQHYADSDNLQIYLDIKCRPYLCTFCDEVQRNKSELVKHHRRHLGINPFQCPEPGCKYVGANRFHVRRHRAVHAPRQRVCDLCRATFARRDQLVRHIAKHHAAQDHDREPDTADSAVCEIEPYRAGSRWFSRGGHYYVVYRQRNATTSLRCHREGCPARFNIRRARALPPLEPHDHAPEPWVPARNSMFQALKRRSTTEATALSQIYAEEAARYPSAAPHLSLGSVHSSLRKWRAASAQDPWGAGDRGEEVA